MLANIVYLIIFCLINCYLNYLLLDYFIKKPLFNRPEPQAEISLDDIKRLLNDTRHGFKKIEQTFYKGEHMITHETKIFPDYKTIANELGFDLKYTRTGVNNCISDSHRSNSYKGYKWSKITRETYFKEE